VCEWVCTCILYVRAFSVYLLARAQVHEALKLVLVMATSINAAKLDAGSNAAKLAAANPDAKNLLLQELKQVIELVEQEQSPESRAVPQRRPYPAFPAQLAQAQMITIPADGLCLSHACIGAFHAQKWRDEHGEKGYRIGENRSEEQAEEHQAKCFRAHVVQLMREYAQFDQARGRYHQRASAIASGAMPEDYDVPLYAACLNECIEVVPLGFSDLQQASVFGTGPLRISVGNKQEKGEDGAFAGHFVLLQSWLLVEENLEKRTSFPFGVRACSTLEMLASADAVSDHLAASSATYPRVQFAPSKLAVSGASSAAKPARDQLDPSAPASESMNLTLPEVHSRLRGPRRRHVRNSCYKTCRF